MCSLCEVEPRRSRRSSYCRRCHAAKERERRSARREEIAAKQRAYRERNLEACRTREREYGNRNAAARRARCADWTARNGARKRSVNDAWRARNHDRILHYTQRARAKRAGAEGSHTVAEWLEILAAHGGRCTRCGSSERVEKDHIVPLARGGTDYACNLQPLCRSCNARKNARVA